MKKFVGIFLAASMLAGMLSGCGGSDDNNSSAQNGSTNGEASGPVSVHFIASLNAATEDLNNNVFLKEVAESCGLDVTYECISSDWSTKKAALLAAGDLPDGFFGWSVLSSQEVGANKAMLAPLQDLIKENAPDIQAVLDSDEAYRGLVTELDGNIYYLTPKTNFRPKTYTSLQMNMEWLERLNLEVPTTLEEFEDVLRAFRDEDANGNGDPNDEFPMYMDLYSDEAWSAKCFMGAFDCAGSINSDFVVKDGKVVYQPITENFKEFVKWLRHLREENLMPEEVATPSWSQSSAVLGNDVPIVGVTNCWIKDPINIAYQDQYSAIPPLEGPDGYRYVAANEVASAYDSSPAFVMSNSCQNKEAVIKFVNAFYDPVNGYQINYGPLDVNIKELDNGKYELIDPPEGMDWDTWTYKNSMNGSWPCYLDAEDEALFEDVPFSAAQKLEIDEVNVPYIKEPSENLPVLKFTEEEIEELGIIQNDINTYRDKMIAEWFVNGGIDETWDQYLKEMDNMGMQRYLEIYQKEYDAQK